MNYPEWMGRNAVTIDGHGHNRSESRQSGSEHSKRAEPSKVVAFKQAQSGQKREKSSSSTLFNNRSNRVTDGGAIVFTRHLDYLKNIRGEDNV